jgi:hypothetical protein
MNPNHDIMRNSMQAMLYYDLGKCVRATRHNEKQGLLSGNNNSKEYLTWIY